MKKKSATATEESIPAGKIALDVDLSTTTIIDLEPCEWYRATFRNLPPLERGSPKPFDQDDCLNRLAKLKTTSGGWDVKWHDLRLPAALGQHEAHFWLLATTEWRMEDKDTRKLTESLRRRQFDGDLSLKAIQKLVDNADRMVHLETALAISNLLPVEQYVDLVMNLSNQNSSVDRTKQILMNGFRKFVLPYLDKAQLQQLQQQFRKTWDPNVFPGFIDNSCPTQFYFAAALGLADLIRSVTSRWNDGAWARLSYTTYYCGDDMQPRSLVIGLSSPEEVVSEWKRLEMGFSTQDDVRAFLACTDDNDLDLIADAIVAEKKKEICEDLLKGLALARSTKTAKEMLRCQLEAKSPSIARIWLEKNVGRAVHGLIEVAAGQGKLADAAKDYLRTAKQKGHTEAFADAANGIAHSQAAAYIQSEVSVQEATPFPVHDAKSSPKWLSEALIAVGAGKKKTVPGWISLASLPPLIVGERRLNDDQIALVLHVLKATPISTKHPLLVALRENVAKSSRDEFAWKLFESWRNDGFPSKEKWAMGAIAHLGDDACVMKLTPLIRVWPGELQHQRAVFGLQCLRAIGSNTALMHLAGAAQKLKYKALKAKAEQFVNEIAAERGLTRNELEDRVVPDCGLDEQGRREFSFGPRSFSFVLGGDLKAMIRDGSAKLRSDLPAPNAKDDAAIAEASIGEWKLLKKQVKEVATIQAGRLEQAMVTGRRWKLEDFESLLVRHPLMTHLAQKLVWIGYDTKSKQAATFRITEERDYADASDKKLKLTGIDTISLAHPLELSDSDRTQWGQVMGDYDVVPPFLQLGRPVYTLENAEAKNTVIDRFNKIKLVAPTLVFTLEKLNWMRGYAIDGGAFDEHSKQFPAANVTAILNYEGNVAMGWISPDELLTLTTVYFCEGMRAPSSGGWTQKGGKDKPMKLKDVPPTVVSEVLADMQLLKSKAK